MGHGIVQVSAANGKFAVVAVDSDAAAVTRGMDMIRKSLETLTSKAIAKGTVTKEAGEKQVADVLARITSTTDRGALGACDIIVEAVPETMAIKTPVYKDLARIARADAILASNTSGLPVGELAKLSGRPETTIGLHYFNPVQLMALVEVVKLDSTPASVIAAATKFVSAQGKTPIVCRDTPGFIVNRLLVPYMAQAFKLAQEGAASFRDIDTAMKLGAGYPMGPFHLSDYVGLDTTCSILRNWSSMYPHEPAFFVPKLLEEKVQAGHLGRKTGQGFYTWKGNQIVESGSK